MWSGLLRSGAAPGPATAYRWHRQPFKPPTVGATPYPGVMLKYFTDSECSAMWEAHFSSGQIMCPRCQIPLYQRGDDSDAVRAFRRRKTFM